MSKPAADIIELFSSIQGEGLLVGLRQAFLRFHDCNLHCTYCDTGNTTVPDFCMLEGTPGRKDFIRANNPVALDRVVSILNGWQQGWPGLHHSLSLTGGEPLLKYDILLDWLPALADMFPIYLETNGVLHRALAGLINHISHISMDIKLPSTSGHSKLWEQHREFLKVAARKKLFVKIVIGNLTEEWEIKKASEIIAAVDRAIPLILQPVTLADGLVGISPFRMLELQELACGILNEVRIIPQTHKFIGLL